MPTFNELQVRLASARFRKAILHYLIEHLDSNFMPVAGAPPKQRLLTEEKVDVPVEMFEAVLADTLNAELQQIDQEIENVLAAGMDPPVRKKGNKPPQAEGEQP